MGVMVFAKRSGFSWMHIVLRSVHFCTVV